MKDDELRARFEKWRDSLPAKYWAKYDISACWLGWQACHAAMQGEDVGKLLDYADRLERGEPWMHKGAKFTKWIKEVVSDMRNDAAWEGWQAAMRYRDEQEKQA